MKVQVNEIYSLHVRREFLQILFVKRACGLLSFSSSFKIEKENDFRSAETDSSTKRIIAIIIAITGHYFFFFYVSAAFGFVRACDMHGAIPKKIPFVCRALFSFLLSSASGRLFSLLRVKRNGARLLSCAALAWDMIMLNGTDSN